MILGGMSRPGAVPAFLRTPPMAPPPHMAPPPMDMKAFLQFPLDSPHPPGVSLFHSFNTMDPVQKAVMTHTFGPPMIRTKRPIISCNVCQIRFNSESQAEAHYKGNRHARRVKGIETSKTTRPQEGGDKPAPPPPPSSASPPSPPGPAPSTSPEPDPSKQDDVQSWPTSNGSPPTTPGPLPLSQTPPSADPPLFPACPPLPLGNPPLGPSSSSSSAPSPGAPDTPSPAPPSPGSAAESEEDKAKKLLYCSLCKVAVNSLSQLEAHNKGTKHKTILEARSGLGPIKAYPRLGPKPGPEQGGGGGGLPVDPDAQERTFHCEICNVRVNSELQLKQHISSRRHRDGVAGKPNPLLARHKKRTDFVSSLTFSKELPKTLGAGLLHNPLAVAAAMAAAASSNHLALRGALPHHHHHHPHHHLLQPLSLLRPAPGPMRTAHGPILFTPY